MATPREVITSLVLAPLGVPVLPVEAEINATDFEVALAKYYSYVPYKISREYVVTNGYTVTQPMSSLLPSAEFYYVGVVSFALRSQVTPNRVNEFLIGGGFVAPNSPLDQQAYYNTLVDLQTGDPYYEEDFVNEEVRWVVGSRGSFAVIYGLGHSDPDKIPRRHFELVAALVGCVYYKRLLAIRKTGAFAGADFTLDASVLQAALDEAQTRSTEILESIGLVPVTLG